MDAEEQRRKASRELEEVLTDPEVRPIFDYAHQPSATKTFVNFVVRPYTVIVAILGIVLLVRKDWLLGGILLATWVVVSVSAQTALNRFRRTSRVSELSHEESYAISKLAMKIGISLAAVLFVILLRRGIHWYFGLPVAGLGGFLATVLPLIAVARISDPVAGRHR